MKKSPLVYSLFSIKLWTGVLLFFFMAGTAGANPAVVQQQTKSITGKISDSNGEAIIGASVVVKGTTNGTVTNPDGIFTLSNVPEGATIAISYIGFSNYEFNVGSQTDYNITLKEDNKVLDEVVVVGYGVQKKVNLTGSVSSVNMNEMIQGRPVTNVSKGLAGMVPGLQVISANNRPGNDNSSLLIRGQGTLNNAAPLVLIDGMEGNISSVNPQDIENLSVLKDAASASIYGSRAANGVILITTKQGKKGDVKIDYNGYLSWESLGKTFIPVSNYANYMELVNEGYKNSNQPTIFSQEKIDLWRANEKGDQLMYPNTNWLDAIFRTSLSTSHNLSLSGGSDKIRFFTAFGFMDNPGIMDNSGYKKYDLRANLETDVTSWLKLGTNLNGFVAYTQPGTDNIDNALIYGSATTPGMVFRAPDGRYGAMNNSEDDPQAAGNNLLRRLNSIKGDYVKRNVKARLFGTLTPFKGFSITGSYNYEILDDQRHNQPVFLDGWNFLTNTITSPGTGRTSISEANYKTERNFMDAFANYDINFLNNKLNVHAMLGASQEQYAYYWFSASKLDLIDPNLGVINGGTADMSAAGNRVEWAMRSYFGRINFSWDNKYLLESNLRADGSSRFLPNKRWGYFPSFSAGWRIDQESFMENLVSKGLNNLKFRASYGELGNNALYTDQNLGNYDYLATYTQTNYILNNALAMGLSQTAIANANLTWETGKVTDFGIDFGFLKNRLTGTVDYFNRKTVDILIDLPAPGVHGNASIPKQNSATMVNKGLEFSLNWMDKIGDFSYAIGGNISWMNNKVTKFKGPDYSLDGASMIKEGLPYNIQYVMIVDRIVQTDEDLAYVQQIVDKAPVDPSTGKQRDPFATIKRPVKGDLLYKDVNGDGLINNDDRVTVGNGPNPNLIYGLTVSAGYKGFDLFALVQGLSGVKMVYTDTYYTSTVRWGYQIDQTIAAGRWHEGRTDAAYPRLLVYSDTRNTINSNFWMQNKSFVKIKNIQLGYTIPQVLTKKFYVDKFRVYGSLENFFTFTNYIGMDPEVTNTTYPTMRQAVVGVNLTF
jgi:TonB-linked SusC/RagA family outer membrane protein